MYISITRDMYKHDIETITNNIYYTFLSHDGGGVTPPRKLLTKLTQTTMEVILTHTD